MNIALKCPHCKGVINAVAAAGVEAKNAESPYTSESFGDYSYTKATGESGAPLTWRDVFASRLNAWRKL